MPSGCTGLTDEGTTTTCMVALVWHGSHCQRNRGWSPGSVEFGALKVRGIGWRAVGSLGHTFRRPRRRRPGRWQEQHVKWCSCLSCLVHRIRTGFEVGLVWWHPWGGMP